MMSRLKFYVLGGVVGVGFLFGAAIPALTQEQTTSELVQSSGPLISSLKPALVVDSTGAEVGPFENIGGADSALSTIGSNKFALQVNSKGFVATGVTFSFTNSTCTGTPHVQSLTSNSLYISYPNTTNSSLATSENFNGGVAGSILYYAEPKTSASMTINSISVVASSGKSKVCYPIPATKESVSLVATTDLSKLPFVPPFKLSY
jgi:hypothetical protein